MKTYFVTGTDTDCGKTHVTGQFVRYLRRQGHQALGIKPVASGCDMHEGVLLSGDALHLQDANGTDDIEICRWRFAEPISPHLASMLSGVRLSVKEIADFCQSPSFLSDYLLVEGAGGLMVPLNHTETWLDFLLYTKMPVILVVGMRLGCINHALLTMSVLTTHNIPCVGWVANCLDPEMQALSDNIDTLSKNIPCPLLVTIPYGKNLDTDFSMHLL
jgi:dethiobiotin synthetase